MITVRKVTRSPTAVTPGWLIVTCGACLAVPLARLAALPLAAGPSMSGTGGLVRQPSSEEQLAAVAPQRAVDGY
jgi:hypothetical protein